MTSCARSRQTGVALVMIIGVVAALAIMTTILVAMIANAQSGTAKDRTRVKAFNVAEGALDDGLYLLNANWPRLPGDQVWTPAEAQAFWERFADPGGQGTHNEFPAPAGGRDFASVQVYDDDGAGGITTPSYEYDKNANSLLWVVAQGATGSGSAAIQALFRRVPFATTVPRGTVLFAGGQLTSNSANDKFMVEVPFPIPLDQGGGMFVRVATLPYPNKDPIDYTSGIQPPLTGPAAGTLEAVFPAATRAYFIALARSHGRYFSGPNAVADALTSPVDRQWSPQGGVSGLTVVCPDTATTLQVPNTPEVINSEARPGALILVKSPDGTTSNFDFQGSGNNKPAYGYYGVMYTDGTVKKGSGGYNIHGMLVAAGNAEFEGTVNIYYNDNCIVNLGGQWSTNVTMVANSWREIRPVFP